MNWILDFLVMDESRKARFLSGFFAGALNTAVTCKKVYFVLPYQKHKVHG
jgi:hypothetical protein